MDADELRAIRDSLQDDLYKCSEGNARDAHERISAVAAALQVLLAHLTDAAPQKIPAE
jgi:hypothetical protein